MAGETGLREYKMVDYWIYTTKRQKQVKRWTIVYNLDKESQKSIENRVKKPKTENTRYLEEIKWRIA